MTRRIVITGAPGTGKSSLIEELKSQGFYCCEEISRQVIREARKEGTDQLFLRDALKFSRLVMDLRIKQFKEAKQQNKTMIFMDRGLPDVVAYLNYIEQPYPTNYITQCQRFRYDDVFLLEPWEEIYKQDEERYESYEEATQIHKHLVLTYKDLNYSLLSIPHDTVENRIQILLDSLNL